MTTKNTLDILMGVSQGSFFLDTCQLARVLGVQPKTLHNWQSENKKKLGNRRKLNFPLQPIRHTGGRPLYHINDIAEYIDTLPRSLLKKKRGRPSKTQEIANREQLKEASKRARTANRR